MPSVDVHAPQDLHAARRPMDDRCSASVHARRARPDVRRLVATAPGVLEWQDTPDPQLRDDTDVIVRPIAVTVCDLDRPMVTGGFPLPFPIPLGHELVAEVVDAGSAVVQHATGDIVVVPFQISCGTCGSCRAGLTANCDSVPVRAQYGFGAVGGDWGCGFADLVRVPYADAMLVPVPAGVAPEAVAAAGDNLADGYRCVAPHLGRVPGAAVLVLGGIGSVPLYAAMFASALGAGVVDYVDIDSARRRTAEAVGATAHEGVPPGCEGSYDVVVDGTLFDPAGLTTATRALRRDGVIVGATIYLTDPTIPYFDLYLKGAHLHTGRVHARALAPAVVDLVASGAVDPMQVTAGEVRPWEDALHLLAAGTKPVFVR